MAFTMTQAYPDAGRGPAIGFCGSPNESIDDFVRVDALRGFDELVRELGGNPRERLAHECINPDVIEKEDGILSYRALAHLLHNCATGLACPSFGLQLAAKQGGLPVLGPLEIAMMNSETFGDAYAYCTEHLGSYSSAVQLSLSAPRKAGMRYLRFDILLNRLPFQQQAIEHAIGLMCRAISHLSTGEIHVREVWFAHDPIADAITYRRLLGTKVLFGKPFNAVFVNTEDFARVLPRRDRRLYELATSYIESRYPAADKLLSAQVRVVGSKLLSQGRCTHKEVSEQLGLHPRSLQRRLREEGASFGELRDELRRELALRYLGQKSMTLTQVASMLGYSEPSVLTRSCHRWFGSSPRQMRRELTRVKGH